MAPQNLRIEGMTSKVFFVHFIHKIATDRLQDFVVSILTDLTDALGGTFHATVSLHKNKQGAPLSVFDKSSIRLEFPEYRWLSDVGERVSELVKRLPENAELLYVSVGLSSHAANTNTNAWDYLTFALAAKDGVYVEKKMTGVDMTIRTLDDPGKWCHGQQVPDYSVRTVEF